MTKYLLIALAVLALVSGAFAKIEHDRAVIADQKAQAATEHAKNAEKALGAANRQIKLQQATSLQRQQELNRLRAQAEATQKALNDALAANPDWARARVPDGVLDALDAAAAPGKAGPSVDRADAHPGP